MTCLLQPFWALINNKLKLKLNCESSRWDAHFDVKNVEETSGNKVDILQREMPLAQKST